MVQAKAEPGNTGSDRGKGIHRPVYQLAVYEPKTGLWAEMPTIPGFSDGLPMFCEIAVVGLDLVVLGGWDSATYKALDSVFVYSFLTGKWRRGADMPGGPRTFFGCASDRRRFVYVAGGHSEDKTALTSAFVYDVANDKWTPLPDMAKERDECKAVFHSGKFRVIGGYCTDMQGRFEKTSEVFDVATWEWGPVKEMFLDAATCPRTCVYGGDDVDERVYRDGEGGEVTMKVGDTWRVVVNVGDEMRNVVFMMPMDGKMVVIGSRMHGEAHVGVEVDVESGKYKKLDIPQSFTGHVQSGCLLEI